MIRASFTKTSEVRTFFGRTDGSHIQQDGQCTYNLTLRRVRVTIFAVEKQ
jgi:hypothetical protein